VCLQRCAEALKIGCSVITWRKFDTVDALKAALKVLADTGYEGVELGVDFLPNGARSVVLEYVKQVGLSVSDVTGLLSKETVDLAVEMGCKRFCTVSFAKALDELVGVAGEVGGYASARGVEVAVHPHLGTIVENGEQIDAFFSRRIPDSVKICFDPVHLLAGGVDPVGFLRKYRDKIILVHLKDLRAKIPPAQIDYQRDFVNMGDGIIDLPAVFNELRQIGYDGWCIVEVDFPQKGTPAQCVAANREYLKTHLK
jgi:sugar phosphate isomerase/epimerase